MCKAILGQDNNIYEAHPKHGRGADVLNFRNSLKVADQRKSHLIFNNLGTSAHPLRKNDDLVLTQIRNGIDGIVPYRKNTPDKKADCNQQNEIPVAEGQFD